MSSISSKSMHHAHPAPGAFDPETGKIAPQAPKPKAPAPKGLPGWLFGAAAAGLGIAAIAAVLSLRSSTPRKPAKRGAKRAKAATTRRGPAKKTS